MIRQTVSASREVLLSGLILMLLFDVALAKCTDDAMNITSILEQNAALVICEANTLPVGAQSVGGTTASAQTDLGSALRILYQGGDLGDILAEQLVEIDYTLKPGKFGTWKLQGGVETDAEIYPKLAMSLDTAGQSSLKDQLSKSIESFDAFSMALVLVPENEEKLRIKARNLAFAYSKGVKMITQLRADPTMSLQTAAQTVEGANRTTNALERGTRRAAAASLANRNTLTFSAKQHFRSGVTGPDKTTVNVGYEMGIANADSAMSLLQRQGDCSVEALTLNSVDKTPKLTSVGEACLLKYMSLANSLQIDDKRHRFKIQIDYTEVDDYSFTDPMTMFDATFKNTRAFALTGSYSREAAAPIKEVNKAHFAVEFSFEDVKDNEELNDRALLKATYSLDFGDWELPITLSWSNKSELIGDAGSKLGSHIGIQFRPDNN